MSPSKVLTGSGPEVRRQRKVDLEKAREQDIFIEGTPITWYLPRDKGERDRVQRQILLEIYITFRCQSSRQNHRIEPEVRSVRFCQ